MAIKKKLVCFKKQANFDQKLQAGEISDYSIVFIKDTQKIWTHGVYFSSLKELLEKIEALPTSDTTYDLVLEGDKLKFTSSAGGNKEIDLAKYMDNTDTTYTLSLEADNKLKFTPSTGEATEIDLSKFLDNVNTTYKLTLEGDTLKLTPSTGDPDTIDLGKYLDNKDTTYTLELTGDKLVFTPSEGEAKEIDLAKYLDNKDTTYTLSLADNKLKFTPSEGQETEIDLSPYLDNTDTKNTAGATAAEGKQYIIGAAEQTENPETHTSGAYIENGKVYDPEGQALATEESVEGLKNSIEELRAELEITATTTTYCFMVRSYGDADPKAKEFVGKQENIKNVAKHLRMAAIRKQGDFDFLAPNRITKTVEGKEIFVDGSDGDIMCATDTKIYLYAEKIEATDGALEIFGVGLVPLTLFGKEAVGYDPFAMACDAATYAQLTSANTDHLEENDARAQLHCIYNENIIGQYTAPKNFFKEVYKANGAGYVQGNYTTLNEILHAQAKNEDPNSNYPYLGLYYRFVEIWHAAAKCELGTMDISNANLLGAGATCSAVATAATWDDEAISGTSGCKIMDSEGNVKVICNINTNNIKENAEAAATATTYGLDSTVYNCSLLPALTPHRVIDAIAKNDNLGYIGDHTKVFNEDGTLAEGVDVSTGEGMTPAKRYYIVRGVEGAESFKDGVMTGVINCYILQEFNDGVQYSDGSDLTGGKVIFKFSTLLYRGFTWSTGHWIWMQGFHYVIHTQEDGNTRYATAIYQRDPKKIQPWKSGMTYFGLDENGDTDYEKGYAKDDTHLSYSAFWAKNSNPSVSLFCYPDQGGNQHTHVCAYTWRNQSYSGKLDAGYRSVNASAFGGSGDHTYASAGSLGGDSSVACSVPSYAASFALLDFMKVN